MHGEMSLWAAALINTHSAADGRKLSPACSHWAVCGELSEAICVCDRPCSLPLANLAASIYRSNWISSLAHAHWLSVSQGSERASKNLMLNLLGSFCHLSTRREREDPDRIWGSQCATCDSCCCFGDFQKLEVVYCYMAAGGLIESKAASDCWPLPTLQCDCPS